MYKLTRAKRPGTIKLLCADSIEEDSPRFRLGNGESEIYGRSTDDIFGRVFDVYFSFRMTRVLKLYPNAVYALQS